MSRKGKYLFSYGHVDFKVELKRGYMVGDWRVVLESENYLGLR
jgi:hypothetical protein